jgi:DNA-binding LytR/AlgR family response regulator
MVRIAVCDDEQSMADTIVDMIQKFMGIKSVNFVVSYFMSGEDLLMEIEDSGIYDIVFLDIELGRTDGISIARSLRENYPIVTVVFVSAHSKYYKAAFDVQPFQYILKPIIIEEFYNILDRVLSLVTTGLSTLSFNFNRVYYRINLRDVLYVESYRRVLRVVCRDREYEYYGKLDDAERCISSGNLTFIRIHKSILVNAEYIREYTPEYVVMENRQRLSISYRRRHEIEQRYIHGLNF